MSRADDMRAILQPANVVLAPMAGVTEAPFRVICKRYGCGLTYTEMVGALSLHYSPRSRAATALLAVAAEEVLCAAQLSGADPGLMAAQAAAVVERLGDQLACLDINMGCPVRKVVARGEGAALMRTREAAAEIVARCVEAVDVPVTVKIRAGWDREHVDAVEFALAMQEAGAAAIAVHGRTRSQFYHGHADWGIIAQVKEAVDVPVLGSGDVMCAADAKRMLEETGVDAVMVARGAQGDPWIFREARALIDSGEVLPRPDWRERTGVAREHLRALVAFDGENAYKRAAKHIVWYVAGLPGATRMRERVFRARGSAALEALLDEYEGYLEEREGRTRVE